MEKLIEKFNKTIKPELFKNLNKKNIFEIPQIEKVVVSSGVGDYKEDDKTIEKISKELSHITGLKAKTNLSRKAVSAFKLRIGQPIGLTITLRGEKMYDFVDKLTNVALPRVRDFRGLSLTGFDRCGNYCLGIREYSIFPEVKYEDITVNFGFQVNIKTTAKTDSDAKKLLKSLGFPFEKKNNPSASPSSTDSLGVKEQNG